MTNTTQAGVPGCVFPAPEVGPLAMPSFRQRFLEAVKLREQSDLQAADLRAKLETEAALHRATEAERLRLEAENANLLEIMHLVVDALLISTAPASSKTKVADAIDAARALLLKE